MLHGAGLPGLGSLAGPGPKGQVEAKWSLATLPPPPAGGGQHGATQPEVGAPPRWWRSRAQKHRVCRGARLVMRGFRLALGEVCPPGIVGYDGNSAEEDAVGPTTPDGHLGTVGKLSSTEEDVDAPKQPAGHLGTMGTGSSTEDVIVPTTPTGHSGRVGNGSRAEDVAVPTTPDGHLGNVGNLSSTEEDMDAPTKPAGHLGIVGTGSSTEDVMVPTTAVVRQAKLGPNRVLGEIEARREGNRVIVSKRHHTVVRWGVALALTEEGVDPSAARVADVLKSLASKGVRPEVVNLLPELVQHVLRTMGKEECTYLASLRSPP